MNKRLIIYILLGIAIFLMIVCPKWTLLILLVTVILLGLILFLERGTPSTPTPSSYRSRKTASKQRRTADKMPKSLPGLFSDQKLIAEISVMTGSRDVTKRLIASYRERFPTESEQWRREKIIYDLKRDKGGI